MAVNPSPDFIFSSATGQGLRANIDYATIQFRFPKQRYNSLSQVKNIQEKILVDPIPPEHIISFSYEDTMSTAADKVIVELFDQNWSKIEDLIIQNLSSMEFRFGWTFGAKSPWRKVHIIKHTPTFEMHGLRLEIEGFDETVAANDEAREYGWAEERYKGNIAEIARTIADKNNWRYTEETIINTKQVLDEEGQPKIFVQKQMPDMTFLKEVLLNYAETPDGRGGFRCWLDADNETYGRPTFYFKPPDYSKQVIKEYIVYKSSTSDVIRFSPDLGDGSLQRSTGALNTRLVGIDPFKKQLYDIVVDNKQTTDNKILSDTFIPDQEITTRGGAGWFERTVALREEIATSIARQNYFKRFQQFYNAELEVVGDPTIKPGSTIAILILDTNNNPLYFSGKYFVHNVTHNINGGNYTSILKLWKNAMREGTLDARNYGFGVISKANIEALIQKLLIQYIPFFI